MSRVFTLHGTLTYAGGEPAPHVCIAVVDEDEDPDDLIGAGRSNSSGVFRLSFTEEAFNQEPHEDERAPDIYLVLSISTPEGLIPVLRRDFRSLRFDGIEDLGTIALPLHKGATPVRAAGLRPTPGSQKRVRRLKLGNEIVAHAVAEVIPFVELFTGWKDLLGGVEIEVIASFREAYRRRVAIALDRADFSADELEIIDATSESHDKGALALWDNLRNTIFLNRALIERQNLDGLKITLGHELVHVGQSKHHSELEQESRCRYAGVWTRLLAKQPVGEYLSGGWSLRANIEGYAYYIEHRLREIYTCTKQLSNACALGQARLAAERAEREAEKKLRALSDLSWQEAAAAPSIDEALIGHSSGQYEAGVRAYLARTANVPARFDPSLRPELVLGESVLQALIERANGGCSSSQTALGDLFSTGQGGVTIDRTEAMRWYRLAAEAGVGVAANNLAVLLPPDHAERIHWFRVAANWGLPSAQHATGQLLMLSNSTEQARVEACSWLRKAADQGEVRAMVDLAFALAKYAGTRGIAHHGSLVDWFTKAGEAGDREAMLVLAELYEKGAGVKADAIQARLWKNRAERARPATSGSPTRPTLPLKLTRASRAR